LAVGGVALAFLGRGREGAQRVGVFPASPADFPAEATDALVMRGLINLYTEDLHAARSDLSFAAGRQQAGVPLKFSSQSLAYLGETEFRLGAWDDGVIHSELAVSLSHDADRRWDYPFVHGLATFVPANRGAWEVAERHVAAAREVAELSELAQHAAVTGTAAAMLAAARADPAGVLAAAEAIREAGELDTTGRPGVYDWRPYEVDALIATGRLDEAQQALDEFEAAIPEGGLQSAEVALERLRGTLACAGGDPAAAAGHFEAARDASEGLPKPFELGLLALADGQRLHQAGDRRAAIERLRNARDAFASLRAQPYLDACDRALEQLGVPAEAQRASAGYGLTPAELAVARLVATGKSNRETAEELYITVKTVEFHLRGVFAKLGISSRRQIAALLGGQD
jgi:DNA-binding CsgD family transcriptional regulator